MAMEHGKHLVMMNVEADVTIGPYLKQRGRPARRHLFGRRRRRAVVLHGTDRVRHRRSATPSSSAGKGKNNPLNHDAVPDDYREEATRRNMNPRMLVEFVDGSKTMVEMAAIANATGLVPDVPGMHGPKADRDELAKVLIPREDGGILVARAWSTTRSARAWRPASSSSSRRRIRASSSAWTICMSARGRITASSGPIT